MLALQPSRYRLTWLSVFLCLVVLLIPFSAFAALKTLVPSDNAGKFLTADQAFQLIPSSSADGFLLDFQVTPQYYLYRDRFKFEKVDGDITIGSPEFTAVGEWKDDPTFGRVKVYHENIQINLPVQGNGRLRVTWQGCADAGLCYPPQDEVLDVGNGTAASLTDTANTSTLTPTEPANASAEKPYRLLILFALGLGLAFTPCILPMLPILASIVARQHTSSALRGFLLALAYVLGVATIYALIGFLVALFGQQINLPSWFQRPAVLIGFSAIFFVLALSLFGLFELRLPTRITTLFDRIGKRQQGGALLGSYLIGIFSALVVSPCVSAPLVGVLLHVSTTGDALYGASALLVMALGMGAPLLLLGVTEGRLLPKAGHWMNEVKTFFGLMLLFVAAELLTRLVPAPLALALYALCTTATGFWLWQLYTGARKHLDILTRTLAFSVLSYAFILIVGAASGGDDPLRPLAQISSQPQAATATPFVRIKTSADLDRELAKAASEGKVLMLDFYADWCVSCKVMERSVFRKPDVAERLARLHIVQADVTANDVEDRALLKRFLLLGPPTILFFNQNGQEITPARLVGEKTASDFIKHLNAHNL